MEFSQLRIFQAVAEEGSITRAAERLHRVPSNLSTRLKQMEEQLCRPVRARAPAFAAFSGGQGTAGLQHSPAGAA